MKTIKLTLAAIALALVGLTPATAQDTKATVKPTAATAVSKADEECPPITEKSTRSRADVRKEGKQAVQSGAGKGEWDCPKPGKDVKARAAVKAEAKEAVKKGEVGKGEADIKK
jgi:hypothetical protein